MQSGSTPNVEDKFAGLELPSVEDQKLQLEMLVQQGVITPEEAQTVTLGQSDMNGITLDPKLKSAQMAALDQLQEIGQGGLTDMDRADFNKISMQEDAAARGKRDSILQNAQSRGMGGSGLELMNNLLNEQESASRRSTRDMDIAALSKQRALDALIQGGQMAGNIQNQDFNQQAQVAGANDAISQFNAANSQAQINQNVGARNAAQAANLGVKQDTANQNVALRNQQQTHNKGLQQQNFQNEIQKRGGQAQAAQQNAQAQGEDSQNQANANNQMIGALIGAGASAYGAKRK